MATAMLSPVFIDVCRAQIVAPQAIEAPLPQDWHIPLKRFLREMGANDIDAILERTKTRPLRTEDTLIVRIEDTSACFQDLCLTVIGRLRAQTVNSLAIFFAGKWVTDGDVFTNMFGISVPPPLMFFTTQTPSGESKIVALLETSKGWIVVPPTR